VRKHTAKAGAILALLVSLAVSACGSTATAGSGASSASCSSSGGPHHAYVVVEHLSGASLQRCVGFSGDSIDATGLMDASGIEYQAQSFSFGKAICQIDHEPTSYDKCLPQDKPYWSLFLETAGAWAVAQTGYSQVALRDGEALGWRYVQPTDPSPAPPPLPKPS
jgi:hypothetical protein